MQAATQNDDKKDAHSNVAQGNTVTPATTPFSTPRRHNNNLSQEVRCIPKPPRLNVVPSSARTIASGFPSLAPPGVSKVSEETEVMKKPYESRTNSIDGINGFEKELSPFPVKPPLFSVQGSHNSQAGICAKTSLYSRGSARDTELKRLRQQYKEELDKSATLLSMLTNAQQRIHLYEDIVCQRLLTPENKSPTPVFRDGTGYDTENGGKKTMLEWWMLLPFFPDLKYEGREDNEVLRDVAIRLAEQQHSLARIKVSVSPPPCLPSMYDGSEDNDSSFCRVLVPPELRGNMTFSDGKHYTLRS
ncbi:hypothetical protein DQ04_03231040 [Trypanosoma grayi]|uniref:hypothetical protein n=1 Tax=Trypanosoma grayi TaxID=71804 RepID=UPI0004F4588D|nr:hypothetical protein DQ04_03231040 [Trypanosoma grayi]KEG10844.1 hypothetical protein DQ04_03231040 [Trypanosoma grayi]